MKIALAQINTLVGGIAQNVERILRAAEQARQSEAELVAFPEMAITGYPPRDLLDHHSFVDANLDALERVVAWTATPGSPGLIVGYVDRHPDEGKGLHNAAALIDGGKIVSRHYKTLLPTYDVFDEARHFEPAHERHLAEFRGLKIGITICEDLWNDKLYWRRRNYPIDPVEELVGMGAEVLISISASPYHAGKPAMRSEMYAAATRRHKIPLAVTNLVGGNDSLIFDGRSQVWGADGRLIAQARANEEDLVILDVVAGAKGTSDAPKQDINEEIYGALTLGVRDYVHKCGFKRVLLGLSGGIDSALTAAIAADALGPESVVGVSMPSQFSSQHSRDDARILAENLGIEYHSFAIEPVFERFIQTLDPIFQGTKFGLAEENLQARIRGNLLMTLSNKFGWMVMTTGNKSELAMGYCTLYGDMSGGLAVLSDVFKTRVYELSHWVNRKRERIPASSITKPPSAELRPNQLDTDSLPPYEELDPIIEGYVEQHLSSQEIISRGHEEALVRRIIRAIDRNEYKRQQAPVGLKVTGKAFGQGRRMPIARGEW